MKMSDDFKQGVIETLVSILILLAGIAAYFSFLLSTLGFRHF